MVSYIRIHNPEQYADFPVYFPVAPLVYIWGQFSAHGFIDIIPEFSIKAILFIFIAFYNSILSVFLSLSHINAVYSSFLCQYITYRMSSKRIPYSSWIHSTVPTNWEPIKSLSIALSDRQKNLQSIPNIFKQNDFLSHNVCFIFVKDTFEQNINDELSILDILKKITEEITFFKLPIY